AFISNPDEEQLLARPEVRSAQADGVARAVRRFLETSDEGSGYVTPYPRNTPAGAGGRPVGCVDPQ
ncbi:MAG: hypothetical protein ACK4N5_15370, partial [Myxococcales bacterium]